MRYISIILILILITPIASANESKVVLEYKGVPGIWFDNNTTSMMLADLSELKIVREAKLPALNLKLDAQTSMITSLKSEILVTERISEKWKEALQKSEDLRIIEFNRYQKNLSKKDKWYKSPPFMLTVGVFIGGLLAVGLSFGLNQGD